MDFVHLPETQGTTSIHVETTETDNVSDVDQLRVSKGGDASDIIPDEILTYRIRSYGRFNQDDASPAVTIRGEFAQLQRELESRIEQFDHTCNVCYEDSEVIIYQLDKQKDYEYLLDYCEIENLQLRVIIVELMREIAADRSEDVGQYPLVIRKPRMFRSGERHLLNQLFPV
ncbi:hypothetical protein [Halosimplex pelagicum]|uniref:Uncharacterized protein n=1 Tax=Halosimplex pelagicum TaxID=869886 RepID=A0A7D5P6P0_9EURY|nr:hypothetical protein [Halosimplex pelagicum]QLH82083.1 hypothetical protein HZS54_10930 [Halosimplex pelagicum]